jgi:hypothetical protein
VVTAVMLLRTRARAARLETWSRDELTRLRDELDRANAVILSEPQIVVDWQAGSDEPGIDGDLSALGVSASHRVLAFGSWLDAGKASTIERAVDALRARGEAFSMTLTTLAGHPIEAEGRQRHQARACRSGRALRAAIDRDRGAARTRRKTAVAGMDSRRGGTSDIRQCRLHPRRRGEKCDGRHPTTAGIA